MSESSGIHRELRRIGVDLEALGGLSVGAPMTLEVMLRWLRSLPTALGHAAFMQRLGAPAAGGGPGIALADDSLAPADPNYVDAEMDEADAFAAEMERVVWPALMQGVPAGNAVGFDLPHGRAAALAHLRRLPDGASRATVLAALSAPPSAE